MKDQGVQKMENTKKDLDNQKEFQPHSLRQLENSSIVENEKGKIKIAQFRNSRIKFPPIGSSLDLVQNGTNIIKTRIPYNYNVPLYETIKKALPLQQKYIANYNGATEQPNYTQNISLEYQIAKAQKLKELQLKQIQSAQNLQSEQRQYSDSKGGSRLGRAELSLPNLPQIGVSQQDYKQSFNYIKLIPDNPLKAKIDNEQNSKNEDKNTSFYSISTRRKISQLPQHSSQQLMKVHENLSDRILKNSHIIMPGKLQESPYVKSFTAKQQLNQVQLDQIKKQKLQHLNDVIKIQKEQQQKEQQQKEIQKKIQEEAEKKKSKKFFGLF